MAATMIYGIKGIGDFTTPDERPKSYHQAVFKYQPDVSAFFGLLSMLPQVAVSDMEYAVFEEGLVPTYIYVNGAHADSSSTTIAVHTAEGKNVVAGTMLRVVRTGEILRVVVDPTSPWTSITVGTRGSYAPSDDKAALVDNDPLQIIASAYGETSEAGDATSETIDVAWNYLQDVEEDCELSDWVEDTELRPGDEDPFDREKRRAAERFKIRAGATLYWGKKKYWTESGRLHYATAGFGNLAGLSYDDSSTGTSLDRIFEIFASMRSHGQGSDTKWAFCGLGALTVLNRIVRENTTGMFDMSKPLNTRQTYGLKVQTLTGPTMELQLIHDATLSKNTTDTNKVLIVDPKFVKLAYKKGKYGKIKYEDIDQSNGARSRKGRYRGIFGLMLGQPNVHAVWTVGSYKP